VSIGLTTIIVGLVIYIEAIVFIIVFIVEGGLLKIRKYIRVPFLRLNNYPLVINSALIYSRE
jgi:hypothetical protein